VKKLVLATRKSQLALWQANHVAARLRAETGRDVELLHVITQGDKILDVPLARVGGKGLFVKEIEEALLDGRADLAVHSLKDVPTALPAGLVLGAIGEREDPRDAIVAPVYRTVAALPKGAVVGTSSLRRQCQLRTLRPDLKVVTVRGNVPTRLARAGADLDAVVLAHAGLKRLGLGDQVTEVLSIEQSLPAIGQGALGIEIREADHETRAAIASLDHEPTAIACRAERALLARLEGGCQVPIAAHATVANGTITLLALVGAPDGSRVLRAQGEGPDSAPEALGVRVGDELLGKGAAELLAAAIAAGVPA
jgi:hydroxymethylbilane synthase